MTNSEGPLAWFITFTTYGTWLHGEQRGSVDREHNAVDSPPLAPDAARRDYVRAFRGARNDVRLDGARRAAVEGAIRSVCVHRGWELLALNVRTNHVHVVVAAVEEPEKVMVTFKAWATRRMMEAGAIAAGVRPWTRHGSTRYLWTECDVADAWTYVVDGQGFDLRTVGRGSIAGRSLMVAARRGEIGDVHE